MKDLNGEYLNSNTCKYSSIIFNWTTINNDKKRIQMKKDELSSLVTHLLIKRSHRITFSYLIHPRHIMINNIVEDTFSATRRKYGNSHF